MAQDKWTDTSGGDFANAANWSTGAVPGASDDALFTTAGNYTVTSSSNETVNSVQMVQGITLEITGGSFQMTNGSGSGTDKGLIQVDSGSTLLVGGTLAGAGTVTLNGYYQSTLVLNSANTTFSGGGKIILSDTGANVIEAATAGYTLVNVSDTFSGGGYLGQGTMALNNKTGGIINATGTNAQLVLNFGTYASINAGLLEATGPAGLVIQGSTLTNTGGTIKAIGTGDNVFLNSSTITGGTFTTTTGGFIYAAGAVVNGVTISSASNLVVASGTTLTLDNTLFNAGTLQVNSYYQCDLIVNTPVVTLSGAGQVIMDDSGANRIYGAVGTDKLINSNNTISGSGQFGIGQLTLDNKAAGIIDATGTAATLTIQTVGFTNEGLLEDTGPAGLIIYESTISNSGTLGSFGAGSHVDLYGSSDIIGGTLKTTGGGVIQSTGVATLDGSTTAGAITITAGSTVQINSGDTLAVAGTIVNDSTLAMNAYYQSDLIANSATVTLTGGGTLALDDSGANRIYSLPGGKLINVNNTITGSGQIGVGQGSIDNQAAGIIASTGAAGMTIQTLGFTNEGLIENTNTGGLVIYESTITNTGTLGSFGAGSHVDLYGSSDIIGGTLKTTGGGVIQSTSMATLDGSTIGAITITAGSTVQINSSDTLALMGTIVDNGTIAMNGYYQTDLDANAAVVTLTGGGTLALDDSTANRIYGNTTTDQLVNVNNTITGSGQIGAGQGIIDNQAAGIIASTGTSGMTLSANGFTNEGLIEATSTGGIAIDSLIVNSGTIAAYGGSPITLNAATIQGGLLTGSGGGYFNTVGISSLDGGTRTGAVTIAAAGIVDINSGQTLDLLGSIVNHGTLAMTGYYQTDLVANSATVTLSGGGTLTMNDTSANRIYGTVATDKLVNVNNTIVGAAQLGAGQLTLDNQAAGTIDAVGATQFNINLGSSFTNEGLTEASGSGGMLIQNTTLTNTGTIAALSASSVTIDTTTTITNYSAGTLTGGTWEAIAATGSVSTLSLATGNITNDAATLVISGAGASITTSGTSVLSTLANIAGPGALLIEGGASFSGATLSNSGLLEAASKGVITLAGGTFTNSGTLEALSGGTVDLTTTEKNANLAAGKLTHGTWIASGAGSLLYLASAAVTNDAAVITLSGAGSAIKSAAGGKSLEATLTTVSAAAQLNVLASRGFASTAAAGITDSGTISLGGGKFSDTSLTIAAGGTFQGGGTLVGAVADNGVLASSAAPTGSAGTLTVTGAIGGTGLLSAAAATSLIASGGYAVGSLSVAGGGTLSGGGSVSGAVTVGGTLAVGSTGTLSAGSLTVQAGGTVSGPNIIASGAIADSGLISLSGGTLSGSSITLATTTSELIGAGTVVQHVANSGTIAATGGTLTLSAGETGGTVLAEASATLATQTLAANQLTISAGGSFIGAGTASTVADSGTLTASGGLLTLSADSGGGAAVIGSGATLDSTSALTISALNFGTGGAQTLGLGTPAGNTSLISNWGQGDTIDVLNTTVTSFTYAPAQGILTLKNGTTTLGTLKFAGSYTRANFNLASDNHSGTDILFVASAPTAISPAADLQAAVSATTGSAQSVGLSVAAPTAAPAALPVAASLGGSFDVALPAEHSFDVHVAVQ